LNLRKHDKLYWLVSYAAVLGLILPIIAAIVAPGRAEAQAPAQTMTVGVIEFRNDSGVQGDVLARFATDAVVIELSKSSRFDVITRAQLDAQMKELGIAPPINAVERNRLGEALQADAMIDGAIKAVEIRGSGATRRALVTLVVRMIDQASGEIINGAVQTGTAQARAGATTDDDKLITEAIDNAAYMAVNTMINYIIPEATVQNTIRTNEVMLNKGARDGIRNGMRMIVTREREIIGVVEVSDVDPDNSIATIKEQTRGIRPEDKARAVFQMPIEMKADPDSGGKSLSAKKSSGLSRITKTILGGLIIWGVVSLFDSDGTESVGGVSAEAGLSSYDLPTDAGTPGVRICWDAKKLSQGKNVLAYQIWRNDVPIPVIVARPEDGEAFDDVNARTVSYIVPNREEPTGYETNSAVAPGVQLGRPVKYYVSAVYVVHHPDGALYYETPKKATGQATPLPQIQLAGLRLPLQSSQQNLHSVTFEWLSRRGADEYRIEVSSDPTFLDPEYVSQPIYHASTSDGQPIRFVVKESLFTLFQSASSDQPIWWRIGARARGDKPGPIAADGRSNMRYIYSEINHFYPVEMPPGQPD